MAALTDLEAAALEYYRAIVRGEVRPKSDGQIDVDFESECRARLIANGELVPDPADDVSLDPESAR